MGSYIGKSSRRVRHLGIGTERDMGPWLDLHIINNGKKRTCMDNDEYGRNVRDIGLRGFTCSGPNQLGCMQSVRCSWPRVDIGGGM